MFGLLKEISIYSFGGVLNKGAMFLLLPLYTRVLQPGEYGKLELVYVLASVLSMLYGLRVEAGYNRIYFLNKEPEFRQTLYSTGQLFNLAFGVLFGTIAFLNASFIADKIFEFSEGELYIKVISMVVLVEIMEKIPLNNIRLRRMPKTYVIISFLNLILVTCLTIYFLVYLKMGVIGVLYAKFIGKFIILLLLYYVTRGEYRLGFSWYQMYEMLGFSIFLIPGGVSSLVFTMSNRFFLQEYQTLEDVGLYSLGAKLAGIIPFLFTEPVKKAFGPHIYHLIDDPYKCKKTLADFSKVFLIGLSIVALAISLFSKEVIYLMSDKSYFGSHNIVFLLSISFLLHGLSGIVVMGIHISRKTWTVSLIWPFSAAANILFNILLIPEYGRMGAALATLISVVIINLGYFIVVKKVYPVPFDYKSMFIILILMISFNFMGSVIDVKLIVDLIIKSIVIAMYVTTLYLTGILDKKTFSTIKEHVINRKKR
jgi:O-antigen/teichoic acid export membrane protein